MRSSEESCLSYSPVPPPSKSGRRPWHLGYRTLTFLYCGKRSDLRARVCYKRPTRRAGDQSSTCFETPPVVSRICFIRMPSSIEVGARLRTASLSQMQHGVFNGLSQQLKTEYVVALLQSFDVVSTVCVPSNLRSRRSRPYRMTSSPVKQCWRASGWIQLLSSTPSRPCHSLWRVWRRRRRRNTMKGEYHAHYNRLKCSQISVAVTRQ